MVDAYKARDEEHRDAMLELKPLMTEKHLSVRREVIYI